MCLQKNNIAGKPNCTRQCHSCKMKTAMDSLLTAIGSEKREQPIPVFSNCNTSARNRYPVLPGQQA